MFSQESVNSVCCPAITYPCLAYLTGVCEPEAAVIYTVSNSAARIFADYCQIENPGIRNLIAITAGVSVTAIAGYSMPLSAAGVLVMMHNIVTNPKDMVIKITNSQRDEDEVAHSQIA